MEAWYTDEGWQGFMKYEHGVRLLLVRGIAVFDGLGEK